MASLPLVCAAIFLADNMNILSVIWLIHMCSLLLFKFQRQRGGLYVIPLQ